MGLVEGTNCGFVTVAPTSDPGGDAGVSHDGYSNACKFTSPSGAIKIIEIGWYATTTSSSLNTQVGVYSHNAGDNNPEELLGSSGDFSTGGTIGWKVATGLDISITENTIYWLASQLDAFIGTVGLDSTSDASYKRDWKTSQTELVNPWGTSSGTSTRILAIYAVYETAAAGTNIKINIGDVHKDVSEMKINIGDSWKAVAEVKQNIGDVWKTVF